MCLVGAEGAKGSNEEAWIKSGSIKPLPEQKIKTKPNPKPTPSADFLTADVREGCRQFSKY